MMLAVIPIAFYYFGLQFTRIFALGIGLKNV